MVGGPSKVFTRKVVVNESHNRKFTKVCKAIADLDASQLYPYSMCQPILTELYTRYELDADLQKFRPPVRTKLEFLKIRSCRNFNEYDRTAELGDFTKRELR